MRSDHRERQVKDPPVWKENAERMIVGQCATYGKNEVGQATHWFAYFERFAGSIKPQQKTSNSFKLQEVLVKDPCVFPCFKREIETS